MGSQQDLLAEAVGAFLHHQHMERGYEVRGGEGEQSRLGWVQEGTELGQRREQRRGKGRTEGGMPAVTKGCPLPPGRLGVADQLTVPALTQRIERLRKWRAGLPASQMTTAHDCSCSAGAGMTLDHGPPKPGAEMAQVTESKRWLLTLT